MRITRTLVMLALATIMAVTMTVTTMATALAQAPAPPAGPAATAGAADARPHKVRGQVTAMSERGFRVKNLKGDTEAVLVNDSTRFRLPGHKDITFGDLHIGDKVMVLGHTTAKDAFTAKLVNIEPRRPKVYEAAGTVTAASATTLTLKNLRGEKVTLVINDKTRIVPKDTVLKVGDKVAVVGSQAWGEKEIVAKVITVKKDPASKSL